MLRAVLSDRAKAVVSDPPLPQAAEGDNSKHGGGHSGRAQGRIFALRSGPVAILAVVTALLAMVPPAQAERSRKVDKAPVALPPPSPPATPAPPPETKPYDPQLMRLAEILGALTYLRGLCGDKDADVWRSRMQALLDAEGTPPVRKDRLAGAYNRGVQGYSLSYRTCTPNAHIVIDRFLAEGERIAKEVENRYHAS